jgi:tetratricopeptide (TPR) repeat protein
MLPPGLNDRLLIRNPEDANTTAILPNQGASGDAGRYCRRARSYLDALASQTFNTSGEVRGRCMREILYRSENLLVRAVATDAAHNWAVTFDHYDSGPLSETRDGFAEDFLRRRSVSVVTILARGNDWFQYGDMAVALAAVRVRLSDARRITTYGSSMGAYAAIRFADAVGAHGCIALSPQYSNDPRKVPFERRWIHDARRIRWLRQIDGSVRCGFRPVVISDVSGEDGRHVRLIARDTPIDLIPLPFVGHPVSTYLGDIGLLETAVLGVIEGSFDPAHFHRQVEPPRRSNAVYLCQLALRQPPSRVRTAIALCDRAIAAAPLNMLPVHVLATKLSSAGRHAEALPLHAQVYEGTGRFRGYGLTYVAALMALKDWPAALAVCRDLVDRYDDFPDLHSMLGKCLWALGEREEGLEHARTAKRLSPTNKHFRQVVGRYRRGIRRARFAAWLRRPDKVTPPASSTEEHAL